MTVAVQVNAQRNGGFVIELSNEHGVNKAPCATMSLDPGGAVPPPLTQSTYTRHKLIS